MSEQYEKIKIKRLVDDQWIEELGMGNLQSGDLFEMMTDDVRAGKVYKATSNPYQMDGGVLGVDAHPVNDV